MKLTIRCIRFYNTNNVICEKDKKEIWQKGKEKCLILSSVINKF